MKRRLCVSVRLLGLLVLVCAVAPAWGHAYLIKSFPAKRAVLLASPGQLQLWFNERLEPRFCSLNLRDERGRLAVLGPLQLDAADPKRLSAVVPRLAPGVYTVKFRVVSVDGHVAEDQFVFTLRGPDASR